MICAIVLAAGHGLRFGANKLLQKNAAGFSLAALSARALQGMSCKVAVVPEEARPLNALYRFAGFQIVQVPSGSKSPSAPEGFARASQIGSALQDVGSLREGGVLPIALSPEGTSTSTCVQGPMQTQEGLSLSLRCGIAACMQAHGWIIALADMPGVSPQTVLQIAAALEMGAPLVACRYRGQRGNPVGFSHFFGPALMNLTGDQGARTLLQQHSDSIHWLDVDDPGILFDVDTPADWQRWLALHNE